jgi:hypothetical protein
MFVAPSEGLITVKDPARQAGRDGMLRSGTGR